MKKQSLMVALLLITSVAAAPIPYIQEIQAGSWPGRVSPPDELSQDVVFEVKTDEGLAIAIRISVTEMVLPTSEPKLEGKMLTFSVDLGNVEIACALERQDDGSFLGECIGPGGDAGYMVMNPPQTP